MQDRFGRTIDYLRISVTDRCNLRCVYCMPEEGVDLLSHKDILRYEEILKVVKVAKSIGIAHVRITGGEPLVRKDLPYLIKAIKEAGIPDLSMTTNGTLLGPQARVLKEAGLDRVNISLDTLDAGKYREITRTGNLEDAFEGMKAAIDAGLHPVKLNMVVMAGLNAHEVPDMARLTFDFPVHVRFIEVMPVGPDDLIAQKARVPLEEIMAQVETVDPLIPAEGIRGAGPAQTMRFREAKGTIGFIGALSHPFCTSCNRLRLTADGKLRPCLFLDTEVDMKDALRPKGLNRRQAGEKTSGGRAKEQAKEHVEGLLEKPVDEELVTAFKKALALKLEGHGLADRHLISRRMCQIGG